MSEDLTKLSTRKLLAMHIFTPLEQEEEIRQWKIRQELATRPHVPTGVEAKKVEVKDDL